MKQTDVHEMEGEQQMRYVDIIRYHEGFEWAIKSIRNSWEDKPVCADNSGEGMIYEAVTDKGMLKITVEVIKDWT